MKWDKENEAAKTKQNIAKLKVKPPDLSFWFLIEQNIYKMKHASERLASHLLKIDQQELGQV